MGRVRKSDDNGSIEVNCPDGSILIMRYAPELSSYIGANTYSGIAGGLRITLYLNDILDENTGDWVGYDAKITVSEKDTFVYPGYYDEDTFTISSYTEAISRIESMILRGWDIVKKMTVSDMVKKQRNINKGITYSDFDKSDIENLSLMFQHIESLARDCKGRGTKENTIIQLSSGINPQQFYDDVKEVYDKIQKIHSDYIEYTVY